MPEETTSPQNSYTGHVLEDLSVTANTSQTGTISTQSGYVIVVKPDEHGYYWHLYLDDDRINGGLADEAWKAWQAAQNTRRQHQHDRERAGERESER